MDKIKKRKMEELQNKMLEEQSEAIKEQIQLKQQINQLESIGKQYLTKEAISRYGNLRLAHPEKAIQVMILIAQAVQAGQLREKIDDKQFKEFLRQLDGPRKEFKIKRV